VKRTRMVFAIALLALGLSVVHAPAQECVGSSAPARPAKPTAAELSDAPPTLVVGWVRGEGRGTRTCDDDTLWIFDADFNTTVGDDAGWLSEDLSGAPGQENHWHKDTIRISGFPYLGDSTWWCGTYNECWAQARGYGNNWVQYLERDFPLSEWSDPGDEVTLEWDQRYAMEGGYDYGYVDVSSDGGVSWTTLAHYSNGSFAGQPGWPRRWDYPELGHPVHSLDAYAGVDVRIRFRFESDHVYSSQDEPDNESHSVLDGAWQLDNIEWKVGGSTVWLDDCESPGDNGWVHDDLPPDGQTGVAFERVFDPDMLRPQSWHTNRSWMMAVDPETGVMVDGQESRLLSPPIDVGDSDVVIYEYTAFIDLPYGPDDWVKLQSWVGTAPECVGDYSMRNPLVIQGPFYGGPYESVWLRDMPVPAGELVAFDWRLYNSSPAVPPHVHRVGFVLDRFRVGIPTTLTPTRFDHTAWSWFYDTFDLSEALSETVRVAVSDDDGIASLSLIASSDQGSTWHAFEFTPPAVQDAEWTAPSPSPLIGPGTEIWYYVEAVDGTGAVNTLPREAPDVVYEFSVLPITASLEEPGILIVDKYGQRISGENRRSSYEADHYLRESLDVLGYEYDVFDVRVPMSTRDSEGPDLVAMGFYDTQVWSASAATSYTVDRRDQVNLIAWLSDAATGYERNLLLSGNDVGFDLIEMGNDTLDFYGAWLASEFIQRELAPGGEPGDSMPGLRDASGGTDFMTHADGLCYLWDHW